MSSQSDPDAPRTLYIGVLSVIVVFIIVVVLQAWFYRYEQEEIDRKASRRGPDELAQLRATQLDKLNDYRWIDRKNNVVAIPLERAMELVVRERAAQKQAVKK